MLMFTTRVLHATMDNKYERPVRRHIRDRSRKRGPRDQSFELSKLQEFSETQSQGSKKSEVSETPMKKDPMSSGGTAKSEENKDDKKLKEKNKFPYTQGLFLQWQTKCLASVHPSSTIAELLMKQWIRRLISIHLVVY